MNARDQYLNSNEQSNSANIAILFHECKRGIDKTNCIFQYMQGTLPTNEIEIFYSKHSRVLRHRKPILTNVETSKESI